MIEIRSNDFETFFQTPFEIYERDAPYVSPMKGDLRKALSTENPLFETTDDFAFWTALRDGRPMGRIVAHHHRASNLKFGTNRASFGFFDCADDEDVAELLLGEVTAWARERQFGEIVGNFNLTAMQQMGVQTDGFDKVGYIDMVQGASHLPRLLKSCGFEPFFPMTTFELETEAASLPSSSPSAELTFAPVSKRTFAIRMAEARQLLNDGFADNPFFVPLSEEEFLFQAGELSTIMDPRLSTVAMQGDDPVGVLICIPDINEFLKATGARLRWSTPWHFMRHRLTRRRAVIIYYSVAQRSHGQGVMSAVLARTLDAARNAGYRDLGITWIADENVASLRMMEKIGAKPLHRLHLFRKALT